MVHNEPAVGSLLDWRPSETATAGVRVEDSDRVGEGGGAEALQRAAAEGGPPAAAGERGVARGSGRAASVPRKPQPKPATKPIPMSGL